MITILRGIDKVYKLLWRKIVGWLSWGVTFLKFAANGVKGARDFSTGGVPIINVNLKGRFIIGANLRLNNGKYFNMIGRQQPCYFIVGKNAELTIGDNVGLSSTAIVCWERIHIGNNVKIGGGVVIYDTDFHSLNADDRGKVIEDLNRIKTAPVYVDDHAFIGSHCIILKGVHIGKYSIIGAGSVVTKSVPENEIWAGNPAKFIRKTNSGN